MSKSKPSKTSKISDQNQIRIIDSNQLKIFFVEIFLHFHTSVELSVIHRNYRCILSKHTYLVTV